MKRFLAILVIVGLLAGIALAVSADPIGVGGSFTALASQSKDTDPTVYKGNGNPQGKPFQSPEASLLLAPIGVGGS
jgi:hypothetical protein